MSDRFNFDKILVVGAGSWGTALSKILAHNVDEVLLYARDESVAEEINSIHTNSRNLNGITLPKNIKAITDYNNAQGVDTVVIVTPVKSLNTICADLAKLSQFDNVIICSKGIDNETLSLPSEICCKHLPNANIAVLSGPNFAKEIALEKAAKTLVAAKDRRFAMYLQKIFTTNYFCPEISDDIVGVEVCGAIKNVIAIAAGVARGLHMGENFTASLLVCALKEISDMIGLFGGKQETVNSLAGLGDLLLTCYSLTSRNTSFGYNLAKKEMVIDLSAITIEGYHTAKSIFSISEKSGLSMPICDYVYNVLYHNLELSHMRKLIFH